MDTRQTLFAAVGAGESLFGPAPPHSTSRALRFAAQQ